MIETKDGQVFKDGALVGVVEGETLVVPAKLHHKVVAQIEKETGLKVVVQAVEPKQPEDSNQPPEGSKQDDPPTPPEPPVEPATVTEEPEPPKDHRGDKTPAYVEWMFRNRPEEAAKRYANRKIER